MVKFLRVYLPVILFALVVHLSASAQNCTINAGVNRTLCNGDAFNLVGTATGSFTTPATWSQIAGPSVNISASTTSGGQVSASVSGYSQGGVYTFRLMAKCTDGTPIYNDVTYTVSNLTIAKAGPAITACPGTIHMAANAVKTGETGSWIVISGNLPLPTPSNSPTGTITLPQSGNGVGTTVYRWLVADGTCTSSSDVAVTDIGGVSPVTATGPTVTINCYTSTASTNISGSFQGNGNGQTGTWSFISGPTTPTFGDIHSNNTSLGNLTGGTYVVRWTVTGPCATGSADVTINVAPPSQDVTQVGDVALNYCDNRTSTVLNGIKPLYSNETVLWTQAGSNPAGAVIANPTSPNTTVSGLIPPNGYDFIYTITNTVTNCTSTGTYRIRYLPQPQFVTFPSSPQVLATDSTSYHVLYSVAGGNATAVALISAPPGSALEAVTGLNNYRAATDNNQEILGMTEEGTYVFRFRRYNNNSSGGCEDAFKDMSIVTSKHPYPSNAGTSQFLACGTKRATLAGNAPQGNDSGTGRWNQISGPNTAVIVNPSSNATLVTGLISGVYVFRWIITGGANVADNTQSDVKIIVSDPPTVVNAGADIGICYGTPVKLNANQPQESETGTWSVVSETPATPVSTITFSNVNDPNAIATGFLQSKTYDLRWTISNTCGSISDDVNINTNTSNGPQQATAGPDQCLPGGTTSFNLMANTPTAGETGTWTLLPGSPNTPTYSPTASTQTVTGAINGNYTFEWKLDKGGCTPSRDTVLIVISQPTTTASITGAPLQTVCGLNPITLTGNTPAANETGTWTQPGGIGGATITSPHSPTTTVTGLAEGAYVFRWTITNTACSSSYAEITYNVGAPPTTASAGTDQTVCNTTSTTLTANTITTGTGTWSVVSGPNTPVFSDVHDPHATLSNLIFGSYVLTWTAVNGVTCPASASNVTITVAQSANAGTDQSLCNTGTTVLTGNEGSTGTWTQIAGPPVTLTPNSNNTYIVTGLVPGPTYTFRYTITAGGCANLTDDVNVIVSGPPSVADAGPDQALCTSNGTSVNLTAVPPTVGTGLWTFSSVPAGSTATFSSATSASTTVNGLTVPGVYIAVWTITNANCTATQSNNDIVRIEVSEPPTVPQAMASQTTNCVSSVVLTGTTPTIGIGTWTLVSGPNTPTIDAPNSPTTTVSNVIVSTTPYIFRWTISNGVCTPSSKDVSVTVVDNTPATAVAGNVPDVCAPSIGGLASVALASPNTLTGNDIGTWTVVTKPTTSPAVVFSNLHSPTSTASNLRAGAYTLRWTVSNLSSCTSQSDVSFTVYDPPSTADAGPPTAGYCLYSPVILSATAPTSGVGTWTVVSKPAGAADPVFSSTSAPNATVTGVVVGNYDFRWTTSNGPCATSQDDIIVTINDCEIAISKDAPTTPAPQSDGSFNVTFVFHVKNTGTVAVNNIQVVDDLTPTFPSPKTFTTVSITSGGGLTANNSFNGNSDKNLLTPGSSSLAAGVEATVTLIVNVKLN